MTKFEVRQCYPGNAITYSGASPPCIEIVFAPGDTPVSREHGSTYVLTAQLTSADTVDKAVEKLKAELEAAGHQAKEALKARQP